MALLTDLWVISGGECWPWARRVSTARANRACAEWHPNAIVVMRQISVLIDSISPLDRLLDRGQDAGAVSDDALLQSSRLVCGAQASVFHSPLA